jgi:hypothetical protein
MLYVPVSSLVPIWNNYTATTTPGVSVTPGTSNAEGTYTELVDGALITEDVYMIYLWISSGFVSTASKPQLLDIGVDEAAGTSYTTILANLSMGNTCAISMSGERFGRFFSIPLFIKAGSSIAVRIQGAHATGTAVLVAMKCYGAPDKPHMICSAAFTETIGTITNSSGPTFTPGTSSAEGTWTLVGATVADLWGFVMSIDCDDATKNNLGYMFDLAYGDASNKVLLIENAPMYFTATEDVSHPMWENGYANVPAGTNIYVRGTCSGTPDTGISCTVIGFGGIGHP